MKKYLLFLVLSGMVFINVNAISSNEKVYADLTEYICSAFQEDSISITGETYFGRCMQAKCDGSNWNLKYYENKTVTCKNGNLNPYTQISSDGCNNYKGSSCGDNSIKYCTRIVYFDCDRTTNGSKYVKPTSPTKPPKTQTKVTEPITEVTEPVKNNNTNLESITLSTGNINFNKDVKEYSISVEGDVSYITVNAKPENSTSKVSVSGNTNLVQGENKIVITVTAEDGSKGTYTISVNKEINLSNNTKLKSISINGKPLDKFDSLTTNYFYKTKEKSIKVDVIPDDGKATYSISDTTNLKDGSTVKISVTAEDKKTTQEYVITISLAGSSMNFGIIIVVIIIIAVLVVGGYYFYTRQKNGGEKEYEYE